MRPPVESKGQTKRSCVLNIAQRPRYRTLEIFGWYRRWGKWHCCRLPYVQHCIYHLSLTLHRCESWDIPPISTAAASIYLIIFAYIYIYTDTPNDWLLYSDPVCLFAYCLSRPVWSCSTEKFYTVYDVLCAMCPCQCTINTHNNGFKRVQSDVMNLGRWSSMKFYWYISWSPRMKVFLEAQHNAGLGKES